MNIPIFTAEEVRSQLRARGLTIVGWAKANNFSSAEVYAVLSGRAKGHWGEAHRIALALGLKSPELSPQFSFLELRQERVEEKLTTALTSHIETVA